MQGLISTGTAAAGGGLYGTDAPFSAIGLPGLSDADASSFSGVHLFYSQKPRKLMKL
ncbi:MAG: hypothetical protein ACLRT5_14590 [Lachnospiraceae bacterium]